MGTIWSPSRGKYGKFLIVWNSNLFVVFLGANLNNFKHCDFYCRFISILFQVCYQIFKRFVQVILSLRFSSFLAVFFFNIDIEFHPNHSFFSFLYPVFDAIQNKQSMPLSTQRFPILIQSTY